MPDVFICPWFKKGLCIYYCIETACEWKGKNKECLETYLRRKGVLENEIKKRMEAFA